MHTLFHPIVHSHVFYFYLLFVIELCSLDALLVLNEFLFDYFEMRQEGSNEYCNVEESTNLEIVI